MPALFRFLDKFTSFLGGVMGVAVVFASGPECEIKKLTAMRHELQKKKQAFSPDAKISVEAIVKLMECLNPRCFNKLFYKADKLKKKVGFAISRLPLPFTSIYDDATKSLLMPIWNWIKDQKPSLPPTWKNLFQVLREPDMELADLADQIEQYLETASAGPVIQVDSEPSGLELLQELRSDLSSLCDNCKSDSYQSFVKACHDKCQKVFHLCGEEKRLLEEQNEKLHQGLKEQEPLSKRPRLEDKASGSTLPTVKKLLRELRDTTASWEDLGVELDFKVGELEQIKADKPNDSKACLRVLLSKWLTHTDPQPSWKAIAEAVEYGVRDQQLASEIRKKYCSK